MLVSNVVAMCGVCVWSTLWRMGEVWRVWSRAKRATCSTLHCPQAPLPQELWT